MHRIWTVALIATVGVAALGFHLHGPGPAASAPDTFTTADTRVEDQVVMQMLTRRMLQALRQADAALLAGLLAPDYQEAPSRWNDPTGYLVIGKRKKHLRRYITGRRQFLRELQKGSLEPLRSLRFQLRDWLPQGDAADCTLEARRQDGAVLARIRLYFTREDDGWQLAMSDGLSLLANLPVTLTQPQTPSPNISDRLLFENTPILGPDATFRLRALLPEYRVGSFHRRISLARWRQDMFVRPFAMALLPQSHPAHPSEASAQVLQLVTDPGQNRILYGHVATGFQAYDAAESGRPLQQPHGIAVDSRGNIYIADTGNGRILIVRQSGRGSQSDLLCMRAFGEDVLQQPFALAWDDRGTLHDTTDDLLWVTDRATGELLAFRASLLNPAMVLRYGAENWQDPVAVAVGRFNGRSDGQLYVADQQQPALVRLIFDGQRVQPVQIHPLPPGSRPIALATDYWGSLYVTDPGAGRVLKLAADLTPLSEWNAETVPMAPVHFQPLFLARKAQAGRPYDYAGYNEGYLLEAWSDSTGLKRVALGLEARLNRVMLSSDAALVTFDMVITDTGRLTLSLVEAANSSRQYALAQLWSTAGRVSWTWDRRLAEYPVVPSGEYYVRLQAVSPSGQPSIVREFGPIELPLFVRLDSRRALTSEHLLLQGERIETEVGRSPRTILAHPEAIRFRVTGFRRNRQYEIQFEYMAPGSPVRQVASIQGIPLHAPMKVGHSTHRTAWMAIPVEALHADTLDLQIAKTSGSGPVGVVSVTLREMQRPLPGQFEFTLRRSRPILPDAAQHGGP